MIHLSVHLFQEVKLVFLSTEVLLPALLPALWLAGPLAESLAGLLLYRAPGLASTSAPASRLAAPAAASGASALKLPCTGPLVQGSGGLLVM